MVGEKVIRGQEVAHAPRMVTNDARAFSFREYCEDILRCQGLFAIGTPELSTFRALS